MNHLISELNTRYSHVSEFSHLDELIPSDFPNHTVEEVLEAASIYYEDSFALLLELSAEIGLWQQYWKSAIPKNFPQSFYSIRIIKTYLRSSMIKDRLNGIALARINKEGEIDVDKILHHFSLSKPRRMCYSFVLLKSSSSCTIK